MKYLWSYARFCNNQLCKQKYKEERDRRMIKKFGRYTYLMIQRVPEEKYKLGRKIAGVYNWSNGKTKIGYLSSYEHDFLRYLDIELHWPPSDIMASPHTYAYEYQGESHYYMPDYFIPSMNLEIEIKDDGSALNINQDSRNKKIKSKKN